MYPSILPSICCHPPVDDSFSVQEKQTNSNLCSIKPAWLKKLSEVILLSKRKQHTTIPYHAWNIPGEYACTQNISKLGCSFCRVQFFLFFFWLNIHGGCKTFKLPAGYLHFPSTIYYVCVWTKECPYTACGSLNLPIRWIWYMRSPPLMYSITKYSRSCDKKVIFQWIPHKEAQYVQTTKEKCITLSGKHGSRIKWQISSILSVQQLGHVIYLYCMSGRFDQ